MSFKYSDTTAREQQIREFTHHTKTPPSTSTARTTQDKSSTLEIILITLLHITIAFFVLGHFTINNGSLLREVYFALVETPNETVTETPGLFQTKR